MCSKPSLQVTPKLNVDWLNPNNEKRPMPDRFRRLVSGEKNIDAVFVLERFRIKNILTKSSFLLFLEVKRSFVLPIPGFSRTTTEIQGLSGPRIFSPIPELPRIINDRGNPAWR